MELLDLTLEDRHWSGPRRREIARAREVVYDYLLGENEYATTPESLDAYFTAYAYAARASERWNCPGWADRGSTAVAFDQVF